MMAASSSSSQYMQWMQPKEEVDENFLGADLVVYDGHRSTRREQGHSRGNSVSELPPTCTRRQFRFVDSPAVADNHPRISTSTVEAWINQELFNDVSDVPHVQQHQDERELYITTLRKDVDEYIEMVEFMRSTDSPVSMNSSIDGIEEQNHLQLQDTEDLDVFPSPVDSEYYQGMYYDEPQLWCFT